MHPPFSNALSAAAIRRITLFGPQTLSNIARSLWVLNQNDGPWILLFHDAQQLGLQGQIGHNVSSSPVTSVVVPGVTDRRFEGKITYFSPGKDFGFIACSELYARYRRDVWVPYESITKFRVGDGVSFGILFKREGYPQATDVADLQQTDGGQASFPLKSLSTQHSIDSVTKSIVNVRIDEKKLAQNGYALHTVGNPGDGVTCPQKGDRICVSYTGRLAANGKVFDVVNHFSYTFGVGAVIAGWDKGIAQMSLGQEARLTIHHSHAYGAKGAPAPTPIPPYADLFFDVKLIGIEPAGTSVRGYLTEFPFDFVPAPLDARNDNNVDVLGVINGSTDVVNAQVERGELSSGSPHEQQILHNKDKSRSAISGSALNVSIEAWLLTIDERGGLLKYKDALLEEYDTVDQIVCVYTKTNPDGSVHLEPEFFEDMDVKKVAHQRLFKEWFES